MDLLKTNYHIKNIFGYYIMFRVKKLITDTGSLFQKNAADKLMVSRVYELLKNNSLKPKDVNFMFDQLQHGQRQKVFFINNEELELSLIKWSPFYNSPMHFHEDKNCIFKIIGGDLTEQIFFHGEIDDSHHTIKNGDISFINDYIGSHSIHNTSNQDAYSLHVYYKPDVFDPVHFF